MICNIMRARQYSLLSDDSNMCYCSRKFVKSVLKYICSLTHVTNSVFSLEYRLIFSRMIHMYNIMFKFDPNFVIRRAIVKQNSQGAVIFRASLVQNQQQLMGTLYSIVKCSNIYKGQQSFVGDNIYWVMDSSCLVNCLSIIYSHRWEYCIHLFLAANAIKESAICITLSDISLWS